MNVRRRDQLAFRQDRLHNRLNGCRAIVERMAKEGTLKPGLHPTLAVLERGWTATEYEKRVTELVLDALAAKKK